MAAQEDEYKKYYAPQYNGSPIDYNAAAQPEFDAYEAFMQQLRPKVDPVMQEKQDKQLAYGKAFWAGANMLGNVISNIMNVNAVKAGAPSAQTYNSDAENRMYQQWREIDQNLRAERRAAQDRYDAASMGLAKLKSNIAMSEAKQKKDIADENERRAYETYKLQEQRGYNTYKLQEQRGYNEQKTKEDQEFREKMQKDRQAFEEKMQKDRQAFEERMQKNRQTRDDAKQMDGLNMTFHDNNGREYSLHAKTKNDALANKSKVTVLVNQFVKDFPDLFTTTRTLRPSDKGYVSPTDKLNYKEGINDVKETITPEMIKDHADFIDQYGLMNNPMFVNRFVDMFGEQYAPYNRVDVTTMPYKKRQDNGSGSGIGYRMPGQ